MDFILHSTAPCATQLPTCPNWSVLDWSPDITTRPLPKWAGIVEPQESTEKHGVSWRFLLETSGNSLFCGLETSKIRRSFPSGITQLHGLHGPRICAKALEISTKAGLLLLPRRNQNPQLQPLKNAWQMSQQKWMAVYLQIYQF